MKFIINTKKFIKYVTPAVDIASKNTVKYHSCAGLIKISTYPYILQIDAYGGSASVTVKVGQSDGYEYSRMGNACVQAKELADALKSFPPTGDLEVCIKDGKLKPGCFIFKSCPGADSFLITKTLPWITRDIGRI